MTASTDPPKQSPLAALAWMAGALTSFSLVAISGRAAGQYQTTLELMLWRSIFWIPMLLVLIQLSPAGFAQLRTNRLGMHWIRSICHYGAQFCWLYALMLIPLAELFALEFTAPLWVAVLAPVLIGERLTPVRLVAALIGFAGVLVVIQPGSATLGLGTVLALLSAVGFAVTMIATKRLVRTDTVLAILLYMCVMQFAMTVVLLAWLGRVPTTQGLAPAFVLALTSLTAHFCLAQAFARADTIIVAPMDFMRLPLIAMIGVLYYNEPLTTALLAGGAIVVIGNLVNLWGERRGQPARTAS